jgi:hypothetical protein
MPEFREFQSNLKVKQQRIERLQPNGSRSEFELIELTHRIAVPADEPEIVELMRISILENMKSFLSAVSVRSCWISVRQLPAMPDLTRSNLVPQSRENPSILLWGTVRSIVTLISAPTML